MRIFFAFVLVLSTFSLHAQIQTFDLLIFNPPAKWSRVSKPNHLLFSVTDQSTKQWAQIDVAKSTTSKGSAYEDFVSEWKELCVDRYNANIHVTLTDSQFLQGYQRLRGQGYRIVNKDTIRIIMNTYSDLNRCVSFLVLTNSSIFNRSLRDFESGVKLVRPSVTQKDDRSFQTNQRPAAGYQYGTTNFEDGWTSIVKQDWVEVVKGNIKALLHFPTRQDEVYYTQHDEKMSVFWNLLVAPRYSNLRQYAAPGSNLPESAYFASALLNDNQTGKDVWVTLFSKGKSGWIEIITPDQATFIREFGISNPHIYFNEWDKLINLSSMNRFAVGENDLAGKWSNQFTGSTAYYNLYTGLYSGSTTFASRVNFLFKENKTYKWDLAMGRSAAYKNMKVDMAEASGNWKLLNNWQLWLSDIERTPKTYNAYFSCIRGARILWLQDVAYGSYTAYGKISD